LKIRYKDESAHALRLRLCAGEVDRSAFEILRSAKATVEGIEISASIIGASHLIEYRVGDQILTEILACQGADDGLWRPGDGPVELDLQLGRKYHFECETRSANESQSELTLLRKPLECSASQFALSFRFPSEHSSAVQAETLVRVRTWREPLGLPSRDTVESRPAAEIRTAHSYPGEGLVVFTRSAISSVRVRQPVTSLSSAQ